MLKESQTNSPATVLDKTSNIALNENLPVSSSLNETPSSASNLEPALELLNIGGPVIWILLALSTMALTIIAIKCWQYASLRLEKAKDVEESLAAWKEGQHENALNALNKEHPVSKLVRLAMDGFLNSEEPKRLEQELARQASLLVNQLRDFLKPLEVIASLSPLLGLMGTVLGMIEAFQQMQAAGANVNPSVLSGGIWQALITTAAGLAVAIPVAAIYSWVDRKAERVTYLINDSVAQVFTHAETAITKQQETEKDTLHAA